MEVGQGRGKEDGKEEREREKEGRRRKTRSENEIKRGNGERRKEEMEKGKKELSTEDTDYPREAHVYRPAPGALVSSDGLIACPSHCLASPACTACSTS